MFLLVPYHPYVYEYLSNSNEYKIVLNVESYFRAVSAKNNIPLFGSYNPKTCGLDEKDFYDEMHLKREPEVQLMETNSGIFTKLIGNE